MHASFARPGEYQNISLYVMAQVMAIGLLTVLAVESANDAATGVKAAAEKHEYFGPL